MALPTTTLYALPLILIFLILFFRVSARRSDLKVSIGDAGDAILHERIRQHGNFIEWAPLGLILMALAEAAAANSIALHCAGGLMVLGRILHPFGLKAGNAAHPLRIAGNSMNLLSVAILFVLLALSRFNG